jgi:drug/metabolite transporter (DMT)-like permease
MVKSSDHRLRTAVLTIITMVAFAANSVLCRLALGERTIDAGSFAALRLGSGATVLLLITTLTGSNRKTTGPRGSWTSAAWLFLYAVPFSFAYMSLTAGTGALILFGMVQATMILTALISGERPPFLEWVGLLLALGGLVYLVSPGITAPSPVGSGLMAVAGIGWGVYTLRGRRAGNPLVVTTWNFVRSVPLVIVVGLFMLRHVRLSVEGVLLAVASGAIASGLGYVIWYAALKGLTATRAAVVQLSVPVLAAAGGVVFLSEAVTLRLLVAAVMILGGVGLALAGHDQWMRMRAMARRRTTSS